MSRRNKPKQPRVRGRRAAEWIRANSRIWIALGLFLVSLGVFWNTLGHDFVFDDRTLILQNPQVTELQWGELLGRGGYRPVRTLTYAFNYVIGGDDPFGYHLFNVLLHGTNVVLLFLFLFSLKVSTPAAGSAALIFAVHPVQTAAVAYISGRKDLLAAFFVLLGCWFFLRYRQRGGALPAAMALVSFGLGVLSKEVAIVFPALLLLLHSCLRREEALVKARSGSGGRLEELPGMSGELLASVRRAPWVYGVLTGLAALAAYYAVFITQASRMEGLWGGGWGPQLGTSLKLFAHYLKLTLFPRELIADYTGDVFPISDGLLEPTTLLAGALAGGFCLLALRLYRRAPLASLGMLWFLVCLLPVLQIIPFHELAADHFLYLPLMGAAFLVALAMEQLVRQRGLGVLAAGGLALVTLLFAVKTVDRNRDWENRETLWRATMEKAPGSRRANIGMGFVYWEKGERERAIEFTRRAVELGPESSAALSNLGALYFELADEALVAGDLEEARRLNELSVKYLQEARRQEPGDPWVISNLANTFKSLGQVLELKGDQEAADRYREWSMQHYEYAMTIGSHPGLQHRLIWYQAALLRVETGDLEGALEYLQVALEAFPDYGRANYWAGYCLFYLERHEESVTYLERAVGLDPTLEAWNLLGQAYGELGMKDEALATYGRAVRFHPNSPEVHYNLGVLYYQSEQHQLSRRHLEAVVQLAGEGPLRSRAVSLLEKLEDSSPSS